MTIEPLELSDMVMLPTVVVDFDLSPLGAKHLFTFSSVCPFPIHEAAQHDDMRCHNRVRSGIFYLFDG